MNRQEVDDPTNEIQTHPITWWSGMKWAIRKTVQFCLLFVVIYFLIALIGLIPVNNDFQPSPDGIEIMIVSNLVHTDIHVPVQTDVIDWRKDFPNELFPDDIDRYSHIAFGWGDEGFFINTPNWSDLTLSTAVNALLLPSSTCMHVSYGYGNMQQPFGKSVRVSKEQYQKIVEHLRSSFQRDEAGNFIRIPDSLRNQ